MMLSTATTTTTTTTTTTVAWMLMMMTVMLHPYQQQLAAFAQVVPREFTVVTEKSASASFQTMVFDLDVHLDLAAESVFLGPRFDIMVNTPNLTVQYELYYREGTSRDNVGTTSDGWTFHGQSSTEITRKASDENYTSFFFDAAVELPRGLHGFMLHSLQNDDLAFTNVRASPNVSRTSDDGWLNYTHQYVSYGIFGSPMQTYTGRAKIRLYYSNATASTTPTTTMAPAVPSSSSSSRPTAKPTTAPAPGPAPAPQPAPAAPTPSSAPVGSMITLNPTKKPTTTSSPVGGEISKRPIITRAPAAPVVPPPTKVTTTKPTFAPTKKPTTKKPTKKPTPKKMCRNRATKCQVDTKPYCCQPLVCRLVKDKLIGFQYKCAKCLTGGRSCIEARDCCSGFCPTATQVCRSSSL